MAMDLVLAFAALVHERQFEQGSDIGALAGERDEDGHIGGIVLGVLAVGVEVDRPLVPSDREIVTRDVLPHPHALGQGVTLDNELVRAVLGLRHGPRARRGLVSRRAIAFVVCRLSF
ncbi:hypothetical protein SLA2020_340250 [Shorea laevis]